MCSMTGTSSVSDLSSEKAQTPPVVFVLGGPGSGKGTQCKLLQEQFNVGELCVGELLRREVRNDTEVGRTVTDIMQRGDIVPGHITMSLLRQELSLFSKSCPAVLIDGFPRAMDQALQFEDVVKVCEFVLFFDCDSDVMVERLRLRAVTSDRADDVEDVFRKRLVTFRDTTMPVVEHYRARGLLREVDAGLGLPDEVFLRTRKHFDDLLKTN